MKIDLISILHNSKYFKKFDINTHHDFVSHNIKEKYVDTQVFLYKSCERDETSYHFRQNVYMSFHLLPS